MYFHLATTIVVVLDQSWTFISFSFDYENENETQNCTVSANVKVETNRFHVFFSFLSS